MHLVFFILQNWNFLISYQFPQFINFPSNENLMNILEYLNEINDQENEYILIICQKNNQQFELFELKLFFVMIFNSLVSL